MCLHTFYGDPHTSSLFLFAISIFLCFSPVFPQSYTYAQKSMQKNFSMRTCMTLGWSIQNRAKSMKLSITLNLCQKGTLLPKPISRLQRVRPYARLKGFSLLYSIWAGPVCTLFDHQLRQLSFFRVFFIFFFSFLLRFSLFLHRFSSVFMLFFVFSPVFVISLFVFCFFLVFH